MRISDWSSDVCSSDLIHLPDGFNRQTFHRMINGHHVAEVAVRIGEGKQARVAIHLDAPVDHGLMRGRAGRQAQNLDQRSEEHTSELQSLMRISYAVFCLKKNT